MLLFVKSCYPIELKASNRYLYVYLYLCCISVYLYIYPKLVINNTNNYNNSTNEVVTNRFSFWIPKLFEWLFGQDTPLLVSI